MGHQQPRGPETRPGHTSIWPESLPREPAPHTGAHLWVPKFQPPMASSVFSLGFLPTTEAGPGLTRARPPPGLPRWLDRVGQEALAGAEEARCSGSTCQPADGTHTGLRRGRSGQVLGGPRSRCCTHLSGRTGRFPEEGHSFPAKGNHFSVRIPPSPELEALRGPCPPSSPPCTLGKAQRGGVTGPQPHSGSVARPRAGEGLGSVRRPPAHFCFRPLKSLYICSSFHSMVLSRWPCMPAKA